MSSSNGCGAVVVFGTLGAVEGITGASADGGGTSSSDNGRSEAGEG